MKTAWWRQKPSILFFSALAVFLSLSFVTVLPKTTYASNLENVPNFDELNSKFANPATAENARKIFVSNAIAACTNKDTQSIYDAGVANWGRQPVLDCTLENLKDLTIQYGKDEDWFNSQLKSFAQDGNYFRFGKWYEDYRGCNHELSPGDGSTETLFTSGYFDDICVINGTNTHENETIALLSKHIYNKLGVPSSAASKHLIWRNAYINYCKGEFFSDDAGVSKNKIKYPETALNKDTQQYGWIVRNGLYSIGTSASNAIAIYPGNESNDASKHEYKCSDIADKMSSTAQAYVDEAEAWLNEDPKRRNGMTADITESTAEDTADDTVETTCERGAFGFGWFLCPAAELLTSFFSTFLDYIENSLNWTLLADNSGAIRDKWQSFLNIANIAFAIAFLVMIYSMATSTGLSNYDIKKMLPRLIIVAIAVNLSFYICAALVDLSNIAGVGLKKLISGDIDGFTIDAFDASLLIAGTLIAVVLFLGTGAIAAVIIFIALALRQVALTILVVISPVAFVTYLLPNTQKWFTKWRDTFIRLLLVYPMFAAVWGAAIWTSDLVGAAGLEPIITSLIRVACIVTPALAIIPLFKMSGGAMGAITGFVAGKAASTGLAAKGNALSRKVANNRVTQGGANRLKGVAQRATGRVLSHTPFEKTAMGLKTEGMASSGATIVASRYKELDEKAMGYAEAANSTLTDEQLKSIAINRYYTDDKGKRREVDSYRVRAAAKKVGNALSANEMNAMFVNQAQFADTLKGQEAQQFRNDMYSVMTSKDSNFMGGRAVAAQFRDGTLGEPEQGQTQSSHLRNVYSTGVLNNTAGMSVETQAGLSADQWEHITSNIGTAIIDDESNEALPNTMGTLRKNATTILGNKDLKKKLNYKTQSYNERHSTPVRYHSSYNSSAPNPPDKPLQ